jgi:signal transduction histidine kinase
MNTTKHPKKMRRIAHRLLWAYIILAAMTSGLVAWLAWGISCEAEDAIIRAHLLFIAEHTDNTEQNDISSLDPMIRVFEKPEILPSDLSSVLDLAPGFHEIDSGLREKHILIWERPSDGKRLYFVGDMPESRDEMSTMSLMFIIILLITLSGTTIGFLLTRKMLQPLINLADIVSSSEGGKLPSGFSEAFNYDEIGVLARQMEHYDQQRERFIQGERQFLQDASHELRTPLTVLQGAIELLHNCPEYNNATSGRRLERMERSVYRMQHTVECLLWLAHEENTGQSISKEDFFETIDSLTSEWQAALPDEITLSLTIEPDCVLDDPLHLWLIVIRNLIENAAHHTESGKIEVTIGSDRIRVSDTGCGISEQMLTKITETWIHGSQTQGYGLGLSIVNRIAIRMGWSLNIDSKLDEGTVVTIERQQHDEEQSCDI